MESIYLDNCATTRVDEDVAQLAYDMMVGAYGNPASPHAMGLDALKILTKARHQIAMTVGAKTERVYFTSGGTESNNLAISGVVKRAPTGQIVTTSIEHHSVLDVVAHLTDGGYESVIVPTRDGVINSEDVIDAVNDKTVLVSVMAVNNDTGELLPVKEIIAGVRQKNPHAIIHCDCVQSFGKLPFKLFEYDVDLLSMSGHKIHAPKGIGALYVREGIELSPLVFGGKQESSVRPGTEAMPLIAAFGLAAEKAVRKMRQNIEHVTSVKEHLIKCLSAHPRITINSPVKSSPYVLNISTVGIPTEQMLSKLRMGKVYVSGSAACSFGARSHVIEAMGLSSERVDSVLRIGLSKYTTIEQVDAFSEIVLTELNQLTD